jgi:hypothetical protein
VEEEEVKTNLDSHDGGILMGEQSSAIHHSRKLQVAKIHEGHRNTRNMWGLEGRPLWPRLDYPLSNPIEKSILKEPV